MQRFNWTKIELLHFLARTWWRGAALDSDVLGVLAVALAPSSMAT